MNCPMKCLLVPDRMGVSLFAAQLRATGASRRVRLALAVLLFLLPSLSWCIPSPPQPPRRVNDLAGMLPDGAADRMESLLAAYEDSTSTQIAVVLVPDLEGYEVADYASRLFEEWKIGQQGVNNGLLILVARDDRKIRLETGYGLEERLTDALSRRIIEQDILPLLRNGDVEGGIMAGMYRIAEVLSGAYEAPADEKPGFGKYIIRNFPFLLAILIVLLLMKAGGSGGGGGRATYSGRGRSLGGPMFFPTGGGFGGGFGGGGSGGGWGGFGGGMSGGGGASGSW